jgi:hypothetical protein
MVTIEHAAIAARAIAFQVAAATTRVTATFAAAVRPRRVLHRRGVARLAALPTALTARLSTFRTTLLSAFLTAFLSTFQTTFLSRFLTTLLSTLLTT